MTPNRQHSGFGPLLSRSLLASALAFTLAGCAAPAVEESSPSLEPWSVTAWGELYEVFPEVDPLVAGQTAEAHTHVTRLEDFAALAEGTVEVVLSGPDEAPGKTAEQVFRVEGPERPGVFRVHIRPESPGEYDLAFRIASSAGSEEIRGGRVRVGTAERPGGLVAAPAPKGAVDGGEPLPFLKEEQWRSDFATGWVRRGSLARSVSGLARVRPPAGGEVTVTAPVDGVVKALSEPMGWPYPGRRVDRGAPLFELVPGVAADRSLPTLEAEVAALETERASAGSRLTRLEELLTLEAVSLRQVEEARTRVEILEARHSAATRDLAAARAAREGGSAGALTLRSPLRGEIAAVAASPGQTVAAGEVLARLVRTDRVWLEVAVAPAGARELAPAEVAGVVLTFSEGPPARIENGLRRVSLSPEMAPDTGTVTVHLEAPASPDLILGTRAEAQILLAERREGVVVPASAVIDDGGVPIVYLQLSGERFARQEIHVLDRQGDRALVDHLVPGQRLVRRGGEAIRRSSLMASGEAHGHVH